MKTTQFLVVTVLAALAAGCNQPNSAVQGSPEGGTYPSSVQQKGEAAGKIATNTRQQVKVSATNAFAKAKELAETAVDYSFDQRSECVAQAVAELDSLDQKIREWSEKAATASDFVKIDARTRILILSDQRAALNQKLAALQKATVGNWDEAKREFKRADAEARVSWQQDWQWLTAKLGS